MSDLTPIFVPLLVSQRWDEAMQKNEPHTWRACAYLAGFEADVIEREEPGHILTPVLRGIADAAHTNYLSLMKVAA